MKKDEYRYSNSINYDESDIELVLWRYMSFEKFMSTITTSSLWFSHLSKFSDSREGYFEITNLYNKLIVPENKFGILGDVIEVDDYDKDNIILDLSEMKNDRFNELKRRVDRTYVSCWNISNEESELMWLAYGGSNNSVAIVTKYEKLINALLESRNQGHYIAQKIDYSYSKDRKVSTLELVEPIFLKRRRYKNENELRVATYNYRLAGDDDNEFADFGTNGFNVHIDLNSLIDYVVVNPNASNWFKEMVKTICTSRKINYKEIKSED